MSILVDCPGHGGSLHLPDSAAGTKVRCPKCQTVFTVPATVRPALIRGPIPRPPVPATAETIREAKTSDTMPDRRRPGQGAPGDRPRQADATRRPNVKRNPAGQMVVGMIVGFLVVLVVVVVGGVFLTLRANRSPSAHDDLPPDRRAERDKQGPRELKEGKNLLVNGGFEEGPDPEGGLGFLTLNEGSTAIRGWVVTRGSIDYIDSYWQHAEGRRSLDVNGLVRGGISQTVKTTKGQRYRVTFSLAGNPALAEDKGMKMLGVRAGESGTAFAFDTTGRKNADMGWVTRTWDFVASGDQTTLEFYSLSGTTCGPALDNVSVVALE
jgi:choice-of-anchor C domain-containing protein